eukprot:scaffold43492_cov160-Amphora_coffeaeformis.AAC.1
MTGHVRAGTPVGLSRHLTKVFISSSVGRSGIRRTLKIDTNVMGTHVVLTIDTVTRSSVPRQGHALGRT